MGKKEIFVDEKIAAASRPVLSSLGLSLDSAAQIFFAQCVYKRGLPFEISIPEGVSPIEVDCSEEPEEKKKKKAEKLVSKVIEDKDPYRTFLRALLVRKAPLSVAITSSQDGRYKDCHYQDCPTGRFGDWTILIMRTTLVEDYKRCQMKDIDRAVLSLCGKVIDTYVVGLDPSTKTCLVKPVKPLDPKDLKEEKEETGDKTAESAKAEVQAETGVSSKEPAAKDAAERAEMEVKPLPIKCPLCGAAVFEASDFYTCANALKGCKFVVAKEICGHTLTKNELKMMAEGKKTQAVQVTGIAGHEDAKFARFAFDLKTKRVVVAPAKGYDKKRIAEEESIPSKHDIIAQWRMDHPTGTRAQCEKETGISKRKISKCWNSCNPRSCRSKSAPLLSDDERVKRWMMIHPEKGPKDCVAELTDVSFEAIKKAFKLEEPSSKEATSQEGRPKTKREMIREWIEANPEGTVMDCKAAFPEMKDGTVSGYYSVLYRELMPETARARKEAAKAKKEAATAEKTKKKKHSVKSTKRQMIENWRNDNPGKGVKDCVAALSKIPENTVKWYWYNC